MNYFFIPFIVLPKQGDRARVAKTKGGKPFVMHYTSTRVKKNSESLASLFAEHRPPAPLKGPLSLSLSFEFSWRKSDRRSRKEKSAPKDTKPDLDNLTKQVCDVMESCGFFKNDSQVSHLSASKQWCGSTPGVGVILTELV